MGILLLTLKIIGIVLASILRLVLFLLLILLFVPVRYRGSASKGRGEEEQIDAAAKAGWLLGIVRAEYSLEKKDSGLVIRLFGIRLKSAAERAEAKAQKQRRKADKQRKRSNDPECVLIGYDENSDSIKEEKISAKGKTHVFVDEHEEDSDIVGETVTSGTSVSDEESTAKNRNAKSRNEDFIDITGHDDTENDVESISEKLEALCEKLGAIYDRLSRKGRRIVDSIINLKENADHYYNALTNDAKNREAIAILIRKLSELLGSIRPRKIKGHVEYGGEDPADTGRILAAAAVLYPVYGKDIVIAPDFEDPVLAFDLMLKGRIYLFVIVKILIQLYFNKKVKRFIKIMKKENTNGKQF